ncbi:MAG: hypothetical protein C4331_08300 [Meiothermus sp.]
MATQKINDADVEVSIISTRQDEGSVLTPRELWTIEAADKLLRANEQFKAAYPGAVLSRVEDMRDLDESNKGRYYLRYQVGDSATEFWGYVAKKPKLDFKRGLVGVVPDDKTPM